LIYLAAALTVALVVVSIASIRLVVSILDSHAVEIANLHREHSRYLLERDQRQDERDRSFREELAALNQARMEETASLLQRIQAPAQAVVSHVADQAPPDPAPVRLENDEEMFEAYRERIESLSG
jgi:hypothetical protein